MNEGDVRVEMLYMAAGRSPAWRYQIIEDFDYARINFDVFIYLKMKCF